MATPKSVVILGKGRLAIRAADWFLTDPTWRLTHVVPVVPEPHWMESLTDFARRRGIEIVESGCYRDLSKDCRIDLAISIFYQKIFDAKFLSRCGRVLNLHNGPLPRYRGVLPINWALENRELMHGVTLHEVTSEIDGGPIVAQTSFSIYPDSDEVADVYHRALEYGWTLFNQTMPILDRISPRPQDSAQATYYSAQDAERLRERRGHRRTSE